jgi:hypothetical protein
MTQEVTLTSEEIESLADSLRNRGYLNFTNLANKNAVKRRATAKGIKTFSRTAHGSLLDPRYTVEGRDIPAKGLANNYKQYQAKLYCLEANRF